MQGIIVRNSNKSNIFWQPICAFNLYKVYHAAKRKETGFILITPACFTCWSCRTMFILYPHNMQTWWLSLLQHANAKEHLLPTATGMLLLLIIHICHWSKMEYSVYIKHCTANSPFSLGPTIYSDYTYKVSCLFVCFSGKQLDYTSHCPIHYKYVAGSLQFPRCCKEMLLLEKLYKKKITPSIIHCWDPVLWPLSVLRQQDRRMLYREIGYLVQMVKELHCFTFELKLQSPRSVSPYLKSLATLLLWNKQTNKKHSTQGYPKWGCSRCSLATSPCLGAQPCKQANLGCWWDQQLCAT